MEYDDDLVTTVHRRYQESRDYTMEWREGARMAFDFDAGRQWDDEDIAGMKEQNRIAVTFNRISRVINAIVGTQIQNRQETRYIPREMGDVKVNEMYTAASDWVRDNCDAEDEETDAFTDSLIAGMGWTETRISTEIEPDGEILIERVDPLWMYWDKNARRKNIQDRKWQIMIKRISLDEFEERWPDADLEAAAGPWEEEGMEDREGGVRHHVYPQDAYRNRQNGSTTPDDAQVTIAHYQWYDLEDVYRVGEKATEFSVAQFNKMKSSLEEMGIKHVKQKRRIYREAFIAGNVKLSDKKLREEGFTFTPITGRRDRNKNVWTGVVLAMMDPQKWGNKFFSSIIDIINKNSKGGIIAESDAFDDPREVEDKWASPDAVHWAKPGAIRDNKIMFKPVGVYPAGLDKLMAFALESVHEVVGIPLEGLGQTNRDQSGVVELQRRKQGITMLAPYFDAMRKYRKEQGRIMLKFIDEYISDGRLIRIMGEQGNEEYVPLRKREGTHKFDIIVDESPTSPNQKEGVYQVLQGMLPGLLQAGIPIPPELLDYAPIPSQLAQKWKELIDKQSKGEIPPEVKLGIAERDKALAKLGEENKKLKDKRQETMANMQLKQFEADNKLKQSEAESARKRSEMTADLQMEQEKFRLDVTFQREKAAEDNALQREKLENDLALGFAKLEVDRQAKVDSDAQGAKNLVDEAIDSSLERVLQKPKRRVSFERDNDGNLSAAVVEDVLEDMETAGTS